MRVQWLLEKWHETQQVRYLEQACQQYARIPRHVLSILIAHGQVPTDEYKEDLLQIGRLAVMQALIGFRVEGGANVSTWVYKIADQKMRTYLHRHTAYGATITDRHEYWYVQRNQTVQRLSQELGRFPSPEEVASALGITTEAYMGLMRRRNAHRQSLSLETYFNSTSSGDDEEDRTIPADTLSAERLINTLFIRAVIFRLRQREQSVGYLLGYGYSKSEIAAMEHVSRERIGQIIKVIREKLETRFKSAGVKVTDLMP